MPADPFDPLEKSLHAALRDLPPLRAPSSLEQRVRTEIARRAAQPWWRRPFASWPLAPRAAFFALSGCAACISIAVTLAVLNGPGAEIAALFLQKVSLLRDLTRSVVASGAHLLSAIPPGWFYLAGALVAAAYIGLLGLGAAAYRLLWKSR